MTIEERLPSAVHAGAGRRDLLRGTVAGAGGLGALLAGGWLPRIELTAFADSAGDVEMLQTAASIENLLIAAYGQVGTLPPGTSGVSIPLVATFVGLTKQQHSDHRDALNSAVRALGGQSQLEPDTALLDQLVTPALAKIHGPADVINLAIELETAAAATYVKFAPLAGDRRSAALLASIAPVEAQHVAVLRATGSLLAAGATQSIAIPPDLATLPASAGSVAFPDAFLKTDQARPAGEGAVAAASSGTTSATATS
jgi:hypothetical protein